MKPDTLCEPIKNHPVVSMSEWIEARKKLLVEEKEFTRLGDKMAALRRELPWVEIEKDYEFVGANGPVSLAGLFDGRSQLVMQHFMFGPDWEEGCTGCSFSADHVDPARVHFENRDLSFVAVSRAPLEKIAAYQKRMGWKFNWVSSYGSDFNYDFNVSFKPEQIGTQVFYNYGMETCEIDELPGLTVFYKDEDGRIFQTYSTFGRGQELMDGAYQYIDLSPKGRREAGFQPGSWWRRNDEYEKGGAACCPGSQDKAGVNETEPASCCA